MQQEKNGTQAKSSPESTARALEEYLAAAELGTAPPREEFLARYPELAEDLDACLAALRFIGRAAEGPRSVAAGLAQVEPPEQTSGQLGDFRLLREVGRGGMGVVYEAEQISLGRRVALKVLPFAATMDPRQLQRFHNEARAAASLDHPHIVHIHAVGCERAVHFYAMQFIEGQTLAQMIADSRSRIPDSKKPSGSGPDNSPPTRAYSPEAGQLQSAITPTPPVAAISTQRGPLDRTYFRRVAELGIQAAEALDHAHALGIVHRDIKPANLLVDGSGKLWVTDFGLAHIQSDARLTMTGDLVGTLRYMSPEQALAKRIVVDHRTDVYSLGATLYELLTLDAAFSGSDRQELLRQIAFEEPKTPRRINKAIPAELETIVQKAMEKNPGERYVTAKELADDLRRFLADEPIRARSASVVRRLRKWSQRHKAAVTAATVCLFVTVAALAGSVGWVLGDRANRQNEAEAKVVEALDDAAPRLERGNPHDSALIAAVERAEAQLDSGVLGPALQARVRQLRRDLDMLRLMEEASLQVAAGGKEGFDYAGADKLYTEAFKKYGLDVALPDPDPAAAQVRASAIRRHLVAGLDDWTYVRDGLHKASGAPLTALADRADDDPWRQRLRRAVARRDRAGLEALAKESVAMRQPPACLVLLSRHELRSDKMEELLRSAQQQHPADFWITYQLASVLFKKERPDHGQVIRFLQAALALRPRSPVVRNNLGVALYGKGRLEEAIVEYREAIRLKPDFDLAHVNLGGALRAKGELDKANAEYHKAIAIKPNLAEAHNGLGVTLYNKGRLEEAICEYRKAIAIKPDLAEAHSELGNALRDKGQLDEAIAECRKAIGLKKDFADAHGNLGNALRDKGQLDKAIAEFRKAIAIDPKSALSHSNLGVALLDKGQLDDAIAEFRKAIAIDPKSALSHNNLGIALRDKGQLDDSIAECRRAIAIDPKSAPAYSNLGNALKDKGQLDEAIAEYRKALRIKPDLAVAHNNLGVALRKKGDLEGAIAEYREALRLKQDYAEAHVNLGAYLCDDKGDLDGAIEEFRKAIRLKKDYAMAHDNFGVALSKKGDLDGAIAKFREAIRLKADYPDPHNHLGIALRNKGDLEGAIDEFREAIRLKKDNADAHSSLGAALNEKGDVGGAITELREAIRLNPKHPMAHGALGELLFTHGRFVEARTATRRCLELLPEGHPLRPQAATQLQHCECLVQLDAATLARILKGEAQPADAGERLALAYLCQHPSKALHVAAAHFYAAAFAEKPSWADDLRVKHRYNAACSAAVAGCGAGNDTAKLSGAERAALRKQALDWLRADLDAWRRLLDKQPDNTRSAAAQQMQHWLHDPDFNGVRSMAALGKLPEAERQAWSKLWTDVATTLTQALEKRASEN
jgi:tetratricopeptide (TPR) repeat protein/serine/threonine protein kinase